MASEAPPVRVRPSSEAEAVREALDAHRGDPDAAAEALGISRSQLYRRAKKHGIRIAAYRD